MENILSPGLVQIAMVTPQSRLVSLFRAWSSLLFDRSPRLASSDRSSLSLNLIASRVPTKAQWKRKHNNKVKKMALRHRIMKMNRQMVRNKMSEANQKMQKVDNSKPTMKSGEVGDTKNSFWEGIIACSTFFFFGFTVDRFTTDYRCPKCRAERCTSKTVSITEPDVEIGPPPKMYNLTEI